MLSDIIMKKNKMHFQEKFKYCPSCGERRFVSNCVKSKKCTSCGFVFYLNPSAATAVFLTNEEGKLLVCRRAHEPARGTLDLPGGFVDLGETAEEGILREVKEELGVDLDSVSYLFSIPNDYLYSDLNVPTMDMFFESSITKHTAILPQDDVATAQFLHLKDIDPTCFGLSSIQKAVRKYIRLRTLSTI